MADIAASPRALARLGGALYLAIILIGVSEAIIRERIVVAGDPAATAANLRSLEGLWRLSTAGEYVLLLCAIALIPILFLLLRPVSTYLASVAACLNVVSLAVEASAGLHLLAALAPLGKGAHLKAFDAAQLDAAITTAIRSHNQGFGIALIFFGLECVILGYLIYRSRFFPAAIGVLMQLAGISYLVANFAMILAPAFLNRLLPWILLPSLIGELSFCLWLLIKGVDEEEWRRSGSAIGTAGGW